MNGNNSTVQFDLDFDLIDVEDLEAMSGHLWFNLLYIHANVSLQLSIFFIQVRIGYFFVLTVPALKHHSAKIS